MENKVTAGELRIGNIVDVDYKQGIVNVIYPDCIDLLIDTDPWRVHITNVRGVLLTPEVLTKCGFVETHAIIGAETSLAVDYVYYRLGNMVASVIESGVEIEFAPDFATIEERTYVAKVDCLHQLQNLFYCLCGIELTITH